MPVSNLLGELAAEHGSCQMVVQVHIHRFIRHIYMSPLRDRPMHLASWRSISSGSSPSAH